MYCSGCGQQLEPGQTQCPKCGRGVAPLTSPAVPMGISPVPGFGFELESYRSKVKALAIVWFVWAGLGLLLGFAGLTFARSFFMGGFGHWMNGGPPPFFFPGLISFIWVMLVARSALAVVAGWGLLQQEQWGRIVAIVAAILNLIKFPFGTALGIWTLVMLLGYRNSTLYEQL